MSTRKFTFLFEEEGEYIMGNHYPGREIKHTLYDLTTWDEILPRFKEFLLAIGYVIDGELTVEKDHNEREITDEEKDQDPNMDGC